MSLTNTQKSRTYQKRQQDKGLCTRCGHRELYSAWYCFLCWKKHKIYQEKYRRSKGITSRLEYYNKIKKIKIPITIEQLQMKYNKIKRVRKLNSINIKSSVDFLFEAEAK